MIKSPFYFYFFHTIRCQHALKPMPRNGDNDFCPSCFFFMLEAHLSTGMSAHRHGANLDYRLFSNASALFAHIYSYITFIKRLFELRIDPSLSQKHCTCMTKSSRADRQYVSVKVPSINCVWPLSSVAYSTQGLFWQGLKRMVEKGGEC